MLTSWSSASAEVAAERLVLEADWE